MTNKEMPRVMWLINHGSARKFEVAMLKTLGFKEIFLPKKYPNEPRFRSASVDFSEDANLSIPQDELAVLNEADWYGSPGLEAWTIANRYFDILFFVLHDAGFIKGMVKKFQGTVILRAYGLPEEAVNYSAVLDCVTENTGESMLRKLGNRFRFAHAYAHQAGAERKFLSSHAVYLPLGLSNAAMCDAWTGSDKRIFFVCPDIGTNPYYRTIYKHFIADFGKLPHAIAGAQSLAVSDKSVLGYTPAEVHERNMREMRVMFYHSTEPNHIHYHPFEAIRAGMPLVFMAGGILDRFGGDKLPGRCKNVKEARRKLERILNDDRDLIDAVRRSQKCLLEPMKPENCEAAWRSGFKRILDELEKHKTDKSGLPEGKKRIAVILPVGYRGGSLRGAKLLAQAVEAGSRQAGQDVEVVLAHLNDPASYPDEEFADLPPSILRRTYNWRILGREEAFRAMVYAGLERPLTSANYIVPDDGIKQFMDCDLWIIVSDRLSEPVLPVRPYVLMIYDYLQRYEQVSLVAEDIRQRFISAAHAAERVFVTTEFTRQDAIQFAGLPGSKVCKLPMLAPVFPEPHTPAANSISHMQEERRYFLWTTNLAPHKNHENAFKALRIYYEELDGQLECRMTGVNTKEMLKSDLFHLKQLREIVAASSALKRQLKFMGELPDQVYQRQLSGSVFLWHAGRIDNGTFSVVEAACLGVPALSGDYPAMREIDAQFGLNLTWMDARSPADMAGKLKMMESGAALLRERLPGTGRLMTQSFEQLAGAYWQAVRECL